MSSRQTTIVIDASALLAFLQEEKGSEELAEVVTGALISAVNAAEVFSKLSDLGMSVREQESIIALLALEVVPFDVDSAQGVGRLRDKTRSFGLSLGDSACIQLGIQRKASIYTSDKIWLKIPKEILGKSSSIVCIR